MTERREPTISTYAPSKEEVARHAASKGRSAPTPPPAARSSSRSPTARPVVQKSPLAPFAFIVALIAVGGAGFSYWQLMETQKRLADANVRIAALESKFEMSDDESTASVAAMKAKLKWADSEIRKLWGVSYDTNRKAIKANKDAVAVLSKNANKAAIDARVKKAMQGVSGELSLVSELVDAQQSSVVAIEQQNEKISREYQGLTDKLNILDTNSKQLDKRIETNEQAIEAIDAFRRNVNRQLLEIRGG